jgi:hypothetical protein
MTRLNRPSSHHAPRDAERTVVVTLRVTPNHHAERDDYTKASVALYSSRSA